MHKPHHLSHYAFSCIISLLALLGPSSSLAEGNFGEKTVRLSSFTMENGPVRMTGTSENVDIYLPMASTAVVKNSWLDLKFTHSIMLLGKRSSIRVLFNETTLSQIPYDPDQPMASARLLIPDDLWRTGFNKLSLSVIQHYTDRCEDATSPELWTELDLHDSILSYTVEPVDHPLQMRDLSGLFSPGIGGLNSVLLLNSPKANLSKANSSYLNETLPLVAQSLALRRDYSPLAISHARWIANQAANNIPESTAQRATADYIPNNLFPEVHVLVGTRAELASILPKVLLDQINGPFLHLDQVNTQTGNDTLLRYSQGIRLIVSGATGAEVITAARTLAQMDAGLSATPQRKLRKENASGQPASSNAFLHPDTRYTFGELGRPTTTLHGVGTKRVTVNLPIRGNFYTHESSSIDLSLDFSYGAGMGAGSVMSALLNGEYIQGLELRNTNGMAYRGYRISLPARMLRPGNNTLEFEFSMRAETVAGECRSIPASHLLVQMLDSSSISLPQASAVAIQPNLAAFSATAFPFMADTHSVRTELAVGSEKMLGDALSLAGKLAQLYHGPAAQMLVRTTIPAQPITNTILLATPKEMPSNIFVAVSDSLDRSQHWTYQFLNMVKSAQATPTPAQSHADTIINNGTLDKRGMLMAMRNPHSPDPAALMIISADNHSLLTQRVNDLLTPRIWGQLKGDLVLWEGPTDAVVSMQVGEFYETGENALWHRLILNLSNNPWYMLAALFITIFSISLLTRGYLRRREAQKLSE